MSVSEEGSWAVAGAEAVRSHRHPIPLRVNRRTDSKSQETPIATNIISLKSQIGRRQAIYGFFSGAGRRWC